MNDGSIPSDQHAPAIRTGKAFTRGKFLAIIGLGVAGIGAVIAAIALPSALEAFQVKEPPKVVGPGPGKAVRQLAVATVDDSAQIIVKGQDAKKRNSAILASGVPIEIVAGFSLTNSGKAIGATALKCLTQAVYYEAGFEPVEGRRAVAQVVLNRMRHPAYPNSVCGVVYQGSQRRTGCQFSFTCDGALLRKPAVAAWREAKVVASAALAGHVEKNVGTSTHYHADYVLPKWAFNLGKIDKVGRHIFYRFNGKWGRASAFTSGYSRREFIPTLNFANLRARTVAGENYLAIGNTPGLTVAPHVTDRHAANDVGGRLDVTRQWRLAIPDPSQATTSYRKSVEQTSAKVVSPGKVALVEPTGAATAQ